MDIKKGDLLTRKSDGREYRVYDGKKIFDQVLDSEIFWVHLADEPRNKDFKFETKYLNEENWKLN